LYSLLAYSYPSTNGIQVDMFDGAEHAGLSDSLAGGPAWALDGEYIGGNRLDTAGDRIIDTEFDPDAVDCLQFSELPPPDIYESLAVLDRIVAPTGPCNWPTISSTPRQGLTEIQLMSSHSRRRLHGQPDLIACFYILDTQSGEMQRCTDDVEACLNERLVLLGKDNLPFEITHETLGASGSICCVPLYRQISIRISDALLGSATS
jgi:hypothetical protein